MTNDEFRMTNEDECLCIRSSHSEFGIPNRMVFMAEEATLRIYRGDNEKGEMVDYKVPLAPGMVVLDAVHAVQAMHSPDLAVRWNCKAGKCGSCSGEVNGKPRLMCMDRMDKYPAGEPIVVRPMKTFPVMKDLACDVSWNYSGEQEDSAVQDERKTEGEPRFSQEEADRVQEFRKCIECFLCQNVCHVLREHRSRRSSAGRGSSCAWPASKCTRSMRATGSSS